MQQLRQLDGLFVRWVAVAALLLCGACGGDDDTSPGTTDKRLLDVRCFAIEDCPEPLICLASGEARWCAAACDSDDQCEDGCCGLTDTGYWCTPQSACVAATPTDQSAE